MALLSAADQQCRDLHEWIGRDGAGGVALRLAVPGTVLASGAALMSDYGWAVKAVSDFGVLGVLIVALVMAYRLTDKWAGRFLDSSQAQTQALANQATAMGDLATVVKEGQGEQREVLMAVRLLADR